MAQRIDISDPDDPRVEDFRTLRDAELRKRYEGEAGVFIAEGLSAVTELISSRFTTKSLLVDPRGAERLSDRVAHLDIPLFVAERPVLYEIVVFRAHQGLLACGHREPPLPLAQVLDGARRLLVLEAMNDHENMGALFRTARALGVDGVLMGPRCADPLYRRSVRVSMGHVLHVPYAEVPELPRAVALLRDAGVRTVALTPARDAIDVAEVARDERLALLLGAEGPGLEPQVMAAADVRARIPIDEAVDSLNVAAAAAIALHALRPPASPTSRDR